MKWSMNRLHEPREIQDQRSNCGKDQLESDYVASENLQSRKNWKVLAIALCACVILSACGNDNSITSEQGKSSRPNRRPIRMKRVRIPSRNRLPVQR